MNPESYNHDEEIAKFLGYELASAQNPFMYIIHEELGLEVEVNLNPEPEKPAESIDSLLDQYNDYMLLHKMFGDESYKLAADSVMEKIKDMQ